MTIHGLIWPSTMRLASSLLQRISGARLTVLIFHRVLAESDPLDPSIPDASRFEQLMRLLGQYARIVPLREALSKVAVGGVPGRAVAITFDDGYADNATIAVPILRRLDMTATFFIATGYLDGGRMWNDTIIESVRRWDPEAMDLSSLQLGTHAVRSAQERIAAIEALIGRIKYLDMRRRIEIVEKVRSLGALALPHDLMMTSDQVRELRRQGMDVGAHTVNHPILASTSDAEAETEIRQSKAALEGLLAEPVQLFAYPNGKPGLDYHAKHVEMVKRAGFMGAVSTAPGAATHAADPFQVPRFTPWSPQPVRFGLQLARNLVRTHYAQAV